MNKIKIVTDNKWYYFKTRDDVPEKVLSLEFDYLNDEDCSGYIKYKNFWYHISQFSIISHGKDSEIKKWDGSYDESYYTGMLIKLSADGEQYKFATYSMVSK